MPVNVGLAVACGRQGQLTSEVQVELVSALARRGREEDLAAGDSDRAMAALADDLAAHHIVKLLPEVTALARSLARRHALRAADAVQLASCLYLREGLGERIPFVAFDRRLRTATGAEWLRVLLPSKPRPTR